MDNLTSYKKDYTNYNSGDILFLIRKVLDPTFYDNYYKEITIDFKHIDRNYMSKIFEKSKLRFFMSLFLTCYPLNEKDKRILKKLSNKRKKAYYIKLVLKKAREMNVDEKYIYEYLLTKRRTKSTISYVKYMGGSVKSIGTMVENLRNSTMDLIVQTVKKYDYRADKINNVLGKVD